jgi:hypothetical protein
MTVIQRQRLSSTLILLLASNTYKLKLNFSCKLYIIANEELVTPFYCCFNCYIMLNNGVYNNLKLTNYCNSHDFNDYE